MKNLIFTFLLMVSCISAQVERTEGAFVRLNFNANSISEADSIQNWYYEKNQGGVINYESMKHYTKAIYFNDKEYFMSKYFAWTADEKLFDNVTSIYDLSNDLEIPFHYGSRTGIITYHREPSISIDDNKIDYIYIEGSGFEIGKNDSLQVWNEGFNKGIILSIIGKIDNQYFLECFDSHDNKIGLIDSIDPPYVNTENIQSIGINSSEYMSKIYELNDSVYISKPFYGDAINFHKLENDSLVLLDSTKQINKYYDVWFVKNGNLYFEDAEGLKRAKINGYKVELNNTVILIQKDNRLIEYDPQNDFCVIVKDNFLTVYDIKNETILNEISLAGIKYQNQILIDSPYVYIHRIDKIVDVEDKPENVLSDFQMKQNYPNPFNPETVIEYNIPELCEVKIDVFNSLGEKIETLIQREQAAGNYKIKFDGTKLSSGIYYYKIITNNYTDTKKMILIK